MTDEWVPDEVKRKGGVYYEVGAPVDDGSVEIDLGNFHV